MASVFVKICACLHTGVFDSIIYLPDNDYYPSGTKDKHFGQSVQR